MRARLNNEARERALHDKDQSAKEQVRKEVSRLLRLHGVAVADGAEGKPDASAPGGRKAPTAPRRKPKHIEVREPPTFIRIMWEDEPIEFYAGQRRYLRIETDANSTYFNPANEAASRINIIVKGEGLARCSATALQGGRMRIGVECKGNPAAGGSGLVKVELSRVGMDALSDERPTLIVEEPPPTAGKARMSVPDFDCRPVEGPDDDLWSTLDWPEDVATVASCVEKDGSQIVIYYSRAFPDYRKAFDDYEKKDVALAQSFDTHYQTWVTVHALLHYQDVEAGTATEDDEAEKFAREEFVRVAKVAALMARREVAMAATAVGSGES